MSNKNNQIFFPIKAAILYILSLYRYQFEL